jgi:hypothetical protein
MIVAVAALLVVAGVVAAIMLLNNDQKPSDDVAQGNAGQQSTEQSQPQEPASEAPSTAPVKPVPANGAIDFSQAGQRVIDYYGDVQNTAKRFAMLSSGAQAAFGGQDGFREYWSQFSQVSSEHANGVTKNADGSVNVPVDVTYTKGDSPRTQHQVVRVTRVNGQLVIDVDAR